MPRLDTELPKTESLSSSLEAGSSPPEKGEKNPIGEWMLQKYMEFDRKVTEWLDKQEDPEKTARACKYAARAFGVLTIAGTQALAFASGRPEDATMADFAVRTGQIAFGVTAGIGEITIGGAYFQVKENQIAEKKAAKNAAGEGYSYEI